MVTSYPDYSKLYIPSSFLWIVLSRFSRKHRDTVLRSSPTPVSGELLTRFPPTSCFNLERLLFLLLEFWFQLLRSFFFLLRKFLEKSKILNYYYLVTSNSGCWWPFVAQWILGMKEQFSPLACRPAPGSWATREPEQWWRTWSALWEYPTAGPGRRRQGWAAGGEIYRGGTLINSYWE